jgi:HK97 family phage portal protein
LWPFSRSAKLETRDSNVSDEDGVLQALWSGASSGSAALSGASALRVPAVAAAVRVISEATACLPVRIMERADDGTETEDINHPIGMLLRGDANPWTSAHELIRDLVTAALINDAGGMAFVNRVGAEIREVIAYRPAAISVQYDPLTGEPTYRLNGVSVASRDIVHVRSAFDKSPTTLAAEAIGAAAAMEKHASNLFNKGARPGGAIQFPSGSTISKEAITRMMASWRAAHEGAGNSGKTAVLFNGGIFNPITLKSTDAEFLANRRFQVIEVARAFRVPPSMLFELERATWSNSEQMGQEFLIYCLEPWLRTVEMAFARALFTREERRRYRILLDRDDLTRADLTARATAISSLISAKVLNPNEGREWLDLAPYDGGNEYGNPHINPNIPGPGDNGGPPLQDKEPKA